MMQTAQRQTVRNHVAAIVGPDAAERQQQHERLVRCPNAVAAIDPDGGQPLKELLGSHG